MGFIEETGAAQYMRDARILSIYEGTNGVQAQDLLVQKLKRDRGEAMNAWQKDTAGILQEAAAYSALAGAGKRLKAALDVLKEATGFMLESDLLAGTAVSVPYLKLFGHVVGGVMLFRAAVAAQKQMDQDDSEFCRAKMATADFYMTHILPGAKGLLETIREGSPAVTAMENRMFG
jgi:hypothetical protein